MLCTRIVFTNVNQEIASEFMEYVSGNHKSYKVYMDDDVVEVEAGSDDEELYKLCCHISEHTIKGIIKVSMMRMLSKCYTCFNRDEYALICANVLSREYFSEIPGRMYVYLKVNRRINPIGFYLFMCRDIARKALEYAEDEANKLLELNDNLDMIETLKYFSEMSMESVQKVVLEVNTSGMEITECIPQKGIYSAGHTMEETDILAELVTLNPRCIEIHGKDEFLKNEISPVIEAVFGNRIEYK